MREESVNGDGRGGEAPVLTTPEGHALPRPLDPQVTMDLVQRFVATERARQRRVMAAMGLAFAAVVAFLLVVFVAAGIFMVRNSRKAAAIAAELREQTEQIRDQTAFYAAEIVEVTGKVNRIAAKHDEIRRAVEKTEARRIQEKRALMSDLERFSKWVAERNSREARSIASLEQEIKSLRDAMAAKDAEIAALRKEYEDWRARAAAAGGAAEGGGETVIAALDGGDKPERAIEDRAPPQEQEGEEEFAEVKRPSQSGPVSVVVFPNGDRYEGEFRNGLMEGWGIYTYANGNRYEGEFRNDMLNGRGIMVYANGDRYEGDFRDDMRHGRGKLMFKSGDRYIGMFQNDSMTGKGTMLYANGNRYSGDFRNGVKHGNGIFRFTNGDVYEGEFRYDAREGRGVYTFSDGTKYIGEFLRGQRHGKGRYIYSGGEEYVGEFRNGKKDGTGSCIYPDGRQMKGIWKEDRLIKLLEG